MAELASVRVVATSDVAEIDGGALPVIDGVQTEEGDDLLLTDQVDPARNGVYTIPAGGVAWARRTDADTAAEFVPGMHLFVREGTIWGGSRWHFINSFEPTLDVSILNFEAFARENAGNPGVGLEVDEASNTWQLGNTGVGGGEYTNPSLTIDEQGRIQDASTGTLATTYIDGLQLEWETNRRIRVKAGSAYIPGLDRVLELAADITKAQLVLTANTWYYVYLWENAEVADVEIVTTPPATPYLGYARVKSGTPDDDSRRYLGAVYASAADTMRRFASLPGGLTVWVPSVAVVVDAINTTSADVSIAGMVPLTAAGNTTALAALVEGLILNQDNASTLLVTSPNDGLQTVGVAPAAGQLATVTVNPISSTRAKLSGPVALFGATSLRYAQTAAGASRKHTVWVAGYYERR